MNARDSAGTTEHHVIHIKTGQGGVQLPDGRGRHNVMYMIVEEVDQDLAVKTSFSCDVFTRARMGTLFLAPPPPLPAVTLGRSPVVQQGS